MYLLAPYRSHCSVIKDFWSKTLQRTLSSHCQVISGNGYKSLPGEADDNNHSVIWKFKGKLFWYFYGFPLFCATTTRKQDIGSTFNKYGNADLEGWQKITVRREVETTLSYHKINISLPFQPNSLSSCIKTSLQTMTNTESFISCCSVL